MIAAKGAPAIVRAFLKLGTVHGLRHHSSV